MKKADLQEFDNQPLLTIMQGLRNRGYTLTGGSAYDMTYTHPHRTDHVIRLSAHWAEAAALARICAEQPQNPYLPRIHAFHMTAGNPTTGITVMERLLTAADLPQDKHRPLTGMARAAASLPSGCSAHKDVHDLMLLNDDLRNAVQAITAAATASLKLSDEFFLQYDDGLDRTQDMDKRISTTVLFRTEDGQRYHPVFADPLRMTRVRDEGHRAVLHADARTMRQRVGLSPAP
jgi:hypothetical protein